MKRLSLLLLTLLLPVIASAYDAFIDGIYYNLDTDNSTAEVTYLSWSGGYYTGDVEIPREVNWGTTSYKVKSIGYRAFYKCSELTSITIPSDIVDFGDSAFEGCSNLVSITIPDSVTRISSYLFRNCTNLSDIIIPKSIIDIGYSPFDGTLWYDNLPNGVIYIGKVAFGYKGTMPANTSITIKEGTVKIYENAFYNYKGLSSVVIPEGVTNIESSAFNSCTSLTSVSLPNSLLMLGNQAFAYCSALASIIFHDNISSVGNEAFYGTPWFDNQPNGLIYTGKVLYKHKGEATNSNIIIKEGTVSISPWAFNLSGIFSVSTPESLKNIDFYAFRGCSDLTSISLGPNLSSIGFSAFSECTNLALVTIHAPFLSNYGDGAFDYNADGRIIYVPAEGISEYKAKWNKYRNNIYYLGENSGSCGEDVTYSFDESTGLLVISGNGPMTNFSSYVQTPWKSFSSSIKRVVIESGVTSIGDNAFQECTSLSTITIPNSVDDVSASALTETAWYNNQPDGLVYAGKVAYKYKGTAPEGTEITIKEGTLSITASAFRDCSGISKITIPASVSSIGEWAFYGCSGLTSINVPSGVTSIERYCFYGCTALTTITIPESVTTIGESAFSGCSGLDNIVIPNNVSAIGVAAFSGCSGLTTITIPDGVTAIRNSTFMGCTNLTSVSIPSSVTSLGNNCFRGCNSLTSVTIPNGVTGMEGGIFRGCSSLTSVVIPNSVTYMGAYTFQDCTALTSVTLSSNLTSLDNSTFQGCISLSAITIPENVNYIGASVFSGCSSLTSIVIPSSVNTIGTSLLSGCSSLMSIVVDKGNTFYDSRNNCNAIISTSSNELISGCNTTTIPEGVTSISRYAFSGLDCLTTITIPKSVISINDYSFTDCNGLASISVDEANPKYDSRDNCNAVIETSTNRLIVSSTNMMLPSGISSYNQNALRNCVTLRLPDDMKTVNSYTFNYCDKLVTLIVPGSVTKIEESSFNGCSSLKNLIFEDGTDDLNFGVAYPSYYSKPQWFAMSPLDSVYIGRELKYVFSVSGGTYSYSPFREKETLRTVVFGNDVTTIPNALFNGCVNLTSAVVPERMDSIGFSAFSGCESLTSFNMPQGIKTIGNSAFYQCKNLESVNIPASVTAICEQAFYGCEKLSSLVVPGSVAQIDRGAFGMCTSLSDLVFQDGSSPLTIREESYFSAFSHCPISSVYLGRNIINNSYNYIYSSLGSITTPFDLTISKSVTKLSGGTFANCTKINTLTFEEGADTLTLVNDHNAYSSIMPFAKTPIDSIYMGRNIVGTDKYYPNNLVIPFAGVDSTFSMRIGENMTSIGANTYSDWRVDSLYIPGSVKTIGADAFLNCSYLSVVAIEDGTDTLEFLGGTGFKGCPLKSLYLGRNLSYDSWMSPFRYNKEALATLVIGDSVTAISQNEFVGLKSLKEINFPNHLKSIGYQAFYGCDSLTTINIPESVVEIDEDAFALCRGLTSFILEDGTDSLSIDNNFLDSPLKEVYLGRNIVYPEDKAPFAMLSTLARLTIGKNVSNIGDGAFAGNKNLLDVQSYAEAIPATGQNAFTETYLPDAALMVPYALFDDYLDTDPWSQFGLVQNFEGKYRLFYVLDGEFYQKVVWDQGAVVTAEEVPAKEHYTFSGWSGLPDLMPGHDVIVTGSYIKDESYTIYEMAQGWNWISTNLGEQEAVSSLEFLSGIEDYTERLVGQTEELVWDAKYGLVGNLQALTPGTAYKIKLKESMTFGRDGDLTDANTPIQLYKGWNWLGYLPTVALPVETALENLDATEGDRIISQKGFAEYDDSAWQTDDEEGFLMQPGEGYLYYAKNAREFAYSSATEAPATGRRHSNSGEQVENPWLYDPHQYPDVTTIIAILNMPASLSLGAFCGDECRGVGRWVGDKLFITVHGTSSSNETITFRTYDPTTGKELAVAEHITFQGQRLGSLSAPMLLHVQEATGIDELQPTAAPTRYYSPNGRPLSHPQQGVNIILSGDGSTRKVMIK